MKNLKHITIFIFCFGVCTSQAQNNTQLTHLLQRLKENSSKSISEEFTSEELEILTIHFNEISTSPFEPQPELINRRFSSTQSVAPVQAVDINPIDLTNIENLAPSTLTAFEGSGVVIQNPSTRTIIVDDTKKVWLRGINTGQYSQLGTITGIPTDHSVTGLETLSNGDLYGISTNGMDSSLLLHVNTSSWQAMPIGNNNGLILPIALARDSNDNLYTVDIDNDNLYQLDKGNGGATLKGSIGFDSNFGQGMAFDPVNGKVYMSAFNADLFDSELREINVTTGATMSLGAIVPGMVDQFGWIGPYDRDALNTIQFDKDQFVVYPNPARSNITVTSSFEITSVSIYSILGQLILNKELNSKQATISLSSLTSGSYFIKVEGNGFSQIKKLIKLE